jgi:hypothetical protein
MILNIRVPPALIPNEHDQRNPGHAVIDGRPVPSREAHYEPQPSKYAGVVRRHMPQNDAAAPQFGDI